MRAHLEVVFLLHDLFSRDCLVAQVLLNVVKLSDLCFIVRNESDILFPRLKSIVVGGNFVVGLILVKVLGCYIFQALLFLSHPLVWHLRLGRS